MKRTEAKTIKVDVFKAALEGLSDRDLYTLRNLIHEAIKQRGTQYIKDKE